MGRRNLASPAVVQFYDPANGADAPVPISDNDPQRPSYRLSILNFSPTASPTDFLVLQGAVGVVTRIREIIISGVATSAANVLLSLIRRSTADTGGTSTGQTMAKRDTSDAAAGTTAQLYTANPASTGTAIATVESARINLAPAASASIDRVIWQYSWMNEKGLTLRGAADFIAFNLAGVSLPAGGALDISISFTEE